MNINKLAYFLLLLLSIPRLHAAPALIDDDQIDSSTIAYHIYLVQMASMPVKKTSYHRCPRLGGHSIFGKTTQEIIDSKDVDRIDQSIILADKILSVAKAFSFSSRFQIGYWMGIVHRESLFCLDVVGSGGSYDDLMKKIDSMSSVSKVPYADLGIAQINYITIKDFIHYSFPRYQESFQKLIDQGYYQDFPITLKSANDLRNYFKNNLPTSKTPIRKARKMIKRIYQILIKNEAVNLSFSLPILIDKIEQGINKENLTDKSSRLYKYNRSQTYQKFSKNFTADFQKLDYITQDVWKRSFGVLTYNGHRNHALEYAVDVYCIKSLYDSRLYRDKEIAFDYVYRKKIAPFYRFYSRKAPPLPNCSHILKMQSLETKTVRGEEQYILAQTDFGGEAPVSQKDYDEIYWGGKLPEITIVARAPKKEGEPPRTEPLINRVNNIEETLQKAGLTYQEAVDKYGYNGDLYLYSYLREILYPVDIYQFEKEFYHFLQREMLKLNPQIKESGNIIPRSGEVILPILNNKTR